MCERIYALLLRLYPSRFRHPYGHEALQVFRDRSRDERGFFSTLRLWFDILADLAVSIPRQYWPAQPALAANTVEAHIHGAPSFFVLADESPRPTVLFMGSVASCLVLCLFSMLLTQVAAYTGRNTAARRQPGRSAQPARQTAQSSPRPAPRDRPTEPTHAAAPFHPTERTIVSAAAADLREHYADPELGQRMADALLAHERNGDDDGVSDGHSFAVLLTRQMREITPDRNLTVDYFEAPLPEHPGTPTPEVRARYRDAMQRQDCTLEKVEILPHNIGYLKLNSFPALSVCQPRLVSAMASLNHADTLIFDLRDNGGGEPTTGAFLAAYLFDHPEYWYNPRENTTEASWTRSPVFGNLLSDKPVYVLTSPQTFSGAEQFAYDLKMLKRATLVGETTGGAAHSGVFYRLNEHFGMGIPEAKPINPYAKTDWTEVGVAPDVTVRAADALDTAVRLAQARLGKR